MKVICGTCKSILDAPKEMPNWVSFWLKHGCMPGLATFVCEDKHTNTTGMLSERFQEKGMRCYAEDYDWWQKHKECGDICKSNLS